MAEDILIKFGRAIRQIRCERKISQEEFADMCGMHRSYMSDVELGKRNISLENIQRIADALDLSTFDLFKIAEDSK
mgnify:CR=1 FL=1